MQQDTQRLHILALCDSEYKIIMYQVLKRLNFKNKHKEGKTRHDFVKVTRKNIIIGNENTVDGKNRKTK